jgi:hypothetical protein
VALVAERNTPVRLAFSEGEVVLEAGSGRSRPPRAPRYSSTIRSSRSWARVLASSRDTCIWEIPISSAI